MSNETKITTTLEMRSPEDLKPKEIDLPGLRIERMSTPCPEFTKFLRTVIGSAYRWGGRSGWTREDWVAFAQRDDVETWVAYQEGTPAGYFELAKEADGAVEILNLGLMPAYIGRGLGGHLLTAAVRRAWAWGATRVWLHTCTHDHPHALDNYVARGFQIVKTEEEPANLPRKSFWDLMLEQEAGVNPTLELIHKRRSIRAYQDTPLDRPTVDAIVQAAMRAPTAGNMMLYSIIEIQDQALKDALAESCDHQPFIARAPLVLLFVADYQRWIDFFVASGVPEYCAQSGQEMRWPGEGDLVLACCDALIAAQTAVLAAESLGIGSCYIGDIMERYEYHRDLLGLPQYVFPVGMVCFGFPTPAAAARQQISRYGQECVHFCDGYRRLPESELRAMFAAQDRGRYLGTAENLGQHVYTRKFGAEFSVEMTRSVRAAIQAWTQHLDGLHTAAAGIDDPFISKEEQL